MNFLFLYLTINHYLNNMPNKDESEIDRMIREIEDCMNKLFPDKDAREFVFKYMVSTMKHEKFDKNK